METVIRTTQRSKEADEWALVLAALAIPHRVAAADGGWTLLVPAAEAARASAALSVYDDEKLGGLDVSPAEGASPRTAWAVGLAVGALLLGFFTITGPPMPGSPWFERGAAASGRMLNGEPWRAVTALTLHVDAAHVIGNAIATAALLAVIIQRLGPGCGVWLVLLAGAGANLLAATAYGSPHLSVGASTATFGAIGILAALRFWRGSALDGTRGRRWIVPVATVLLLVMLGTGRGTDVLAHALGLLSGGVLGLVAAGFRRPLPAPIQWTLVAAAGLTVAGCWHLALSVPSG